MTIEKNDFIEIEFTGVIKNTGEVFDTNVESEAKKANFNAKNIKPFTLSVGHKMLPEGFDEDLIGKEEGKEYSIDIKSEKAFGKRNPKMVRMISTKQFHEQKINPVKGMKLSLDGQVVKILSTDMSRTLVDFNNPLAGKEITYTYKILKKVTDDNEKVDALQEFLLKKKFNYSIENKVLTFEATKEFEPFLRVIGPKFEEILGFKVETKVIEEKASIDENKE